MTLPQRVFHPCSWNKSCKHIDAIIKLRPLLDEANATQDEVFLLMVAERCDKEELHILAETYRRKAGVKPLTELERKKNLSTIAVEYINEKGRATSMELQNYLGLTRHEWYPIASVLRKSGKVGMEQRCYVPKIDYRDNIKELW